MTTGKRIHNMSWRNMKKRKKLPLTYSVFFRILQFHLVILNKRYSEVKLSAFKLYLCSFFSLEKRNQTGWIKKTHCKTYIVHSKVAFTSSSFAHIVFQISANFFCCLADFLAITSAPPSCFCSFFLICMHALLKTSVFFLIVFWLDVCSRNHISRAKTLRIIMLRRKY